MQLQSFYIPLVVRNTFDITERKNNKNLLSKTLKNSGKPIERFQ
jgi:hypothetical protein